MKFTPLLLVLCCIAFNVYSQSPQPGGIKGAIQWYYTDNSPASPALRNQLTTTNSLLPVSHATITTLNYHPSLVLSGAYPLRVDMGARDLHSASYFTVYQSLDTSQENSIWYMNKDQSATLVLTTDRMADLSVYQYMNYHDVIRSQPKVNVYVQHKQKDSIAATNQWWTIGSKPTAPELPVTDFKGLVPEIIAYDRVLNSKERVQVATYLALKYGITLTEPGATYLNSAGEKIWDGFEYSDWHRNIAGICRDDASGLKQIIATSSNKPGLLTVIAKDSLNNNSFLLWGDNGKELVPAPKSPGLPLLLEKTWLMKTYGNLHPFTTDIVIDTRTIDASLPANPVYWLAIDPNGTGHFTASTTIFTRMDKLDATGKAFFNNVVWDKDASGKDVWSIIAAQELLLATTIKQPTCSSPRSGSLQVNILGGNAPYQLSVQNRNGFSISHSIDDNKQPLDLANLGTGKYYLKVTDARRNIYVDSFYINNEDAPMAADIAPVYTLPAGRPLRLNAAENMPAGLTWEWNGPSGFNSFTPEVMITTPGLYTLRCSKDGCTNQQDVMIKAAPADVLYDVTVYPNPSTGSFKAKVTLDKPAPVTMSVYSPDGKLVTVLKGNDRANYLFTTELKVSGVYELVFTSGLSKTSRRLVIAK